MTRSWASKQVWNPPLWSNHWGDPRLPCSYFQCKWFKADVCIPCTTNTICTPNQPSHHDHLGSAAPTKLAFPVRQQQHWLCTLTQVEHLAERRSTEHLTPTQLALGALPAPSSGLAAPLGPCPCETGLGHGCKGSGGHRLGRRHGQTCSRVRSLQARGVQPLAEVLEPHRFLVRHLHACTTQPAGQGTPRH